MSLFDSELCCIYGCSSVATRVDDKGLKFCEEHWKEKLREEAECKECQPKCAVQHCINPGPFTPISGQFYCTLHLWKSNRPDSLTHPNQAQWNEEDELRAHGMGITIKEEE